MVRPKKYENDIVIAKTFSLSKTFWDYLNNICIDKKVHSSDYIMVCVYTSDKDKMAEILNQNIELKKKLRELELKVKSNTDAFGVQIMEVPYLEDFFNTFKVTRKKTLEEGTIDPKVIYEIFISKLACSDKVLTPQQAQLAKIKIKEWVYKQMVR